MPTTAQILTRTLLTWIIWSSPNNVSKWQMGFNSALIGLIKFDICVFLENVSRKIRVELKPNNNGYFTYEPKYINYNISPNSS